MVMVNDVKHYSLDDMPCSETTTRHILKKLNIGKAFVRKKTNGKAMRIFTQDEYDLISDELDNRNKERIARARNNMLSNRAGRPTKPHKCIECGTVEPSRFSRDIKSKCIDCANANRRKAYREKVSLQKVIKGEKKPKLTIAEQIKLYFEGKKNENK